jgi:ligand-binding SRPBCC domain-containing protein
MRDTYHLTTWVWLPAPREQVFPFFADAGNLERITPPFLRFRLTTAAPVAMRAGALIQYRLRLRGVPLRWTSEIMRWEPPHLFVDTQLKGPYARWVHTHTFEEEDGGTLVRDHVEYALPGPSFLTRAVNALLVAPDTRRIFEFRHDALIDVFSATGRARVGAVSVTRLRRP